MKPTDTDTNADSRSGSHSDYDSASDTSIILDEGGGRRGFLRSGALAAAVGLVGNGSALAALARPRTRASAGLQHHRFGLNYVPSKNWYFSYNNWKLTDIRADM